jgi:hypothetical protein
VIANIGLKLQPPRGGVLNSSTTKDTRVNEDAMPRHCFVYLLSFVVKSRTLSPSTPSMPST